MDKKEKTVKSEQIYDGKVIKVRRDTVICPNGLSSIREIVSHHGGVGILIKVNDKFIIERQYRYAFDEEMYELPAGKLEDNENDPLEAAKREMLEETGYRPLEIIHLGDMYPTCGYSNEIIHLYYSDKHIKEERHLDSDEFIDLMFVSLDELEQMIKDGLIKDSKILSAFSLYKTKIL